MLKQELQLELKEKIYDMYINKRTGIKNIAEEFNKSYSWVEWKLKQFEIPKWSRGEAKIKFPMKEGKKICSICLIEKDEIMFNKGNNKIDGKESICKECRHDWVKKYTPSRLLLRKEVKKKMVMYKGNICARCNTKNLPLCCYSFHHENPKNKSFEMSDINLLYNWERTKEEIDKCIMLCFNCHQITHFGEDKLIEASDC